MKPSAEVALAEIAKPVSRTVSVVTGESYRTIGVKWWGKGAYERETIDGSRTAAKTLSLVRKGDLIINKIWVRHGSTAIASKAVDGCAASGEFPTFELNHDRVVPEWIHWQTKPRGFWSKCDALSQGTSEKNRIKPELFLTIRVPLPPLAEQRQVVARIEELAAQIHEARTLRHQTAEEAEAFVASRIKTLFERGQNSDWRIRRLGEYVIDDCYGSSEKTHDDSSGTAVLRMGNIQSGRLDIRALKYLHIAEKDRAKLVLKRGDIVFNRTNSAELVGKCAVFDLEGDFAFASYLIRLRLNMDKADPRLVASYIDSPAGRAYMFSERKQMTGQANVNATKLKALPIALPPLPEQRRVVAELDALQAEVDALKRLRAETAAELNALLPAILDKA
ncbi:MAG: restriction endonuclease subunit S, partial [Verrucomicrobiota bacterium]